MHSCTVDEASLSMASFSAFVHYSTVVEEVKKALCTSKAIHIWYMCCSTHWSAISPFADHHLLDWHQRQHSPVCWRSRHLCEVCRECDRSGCGLPASSWSWLEHEWRSTVYADLRRQVWDWLWWWVVCVCMWPTCATTMIHWSGATHKQVLIFNILQALNDERKCCHWQGTGHLYLPCWYW